MIKTIFLLTLVISISIFGIRSIDAFKIRVNDVHMPQKEYTKNEVKSQEETESGFINNFENKYKALNLYKKDYDDANKLEDEVIIMENLKSCDAKFEDQKAHAYMTFINMNSTVFERNIYDLKDYFGLGNVIYHAQKNIAKVSECTTDVSIKYIEYLQRGGSYKPSIIKNLGTLETKNRMYSIAINNVLEAFIDSDFKKTDIYQDKFIAVIESLANIYKE
ncbi:hypothetical protein BB561_003984 [Smittium simulii]|uniref:Uncharacterized protein n=1 Tax=Smittium simulii TaxID=133385 RepID=A0A2T9YIL6_9FUNG|nr:hypothetical protein BB561_003984 [Smittium simulii]